MFEAKSYDDVRKAIGVANVILGFALLVVLYAAVLSSEHAGVVDGAFSRVTSNPLWTAIPGMTILSIIWSFLATVVFRLHDRVYEPRFVKWRASYDSDFILRAICREHPDLAPESLFAGAYEDVRQRSKLMGRLFYRFVGDYKEEHEELLVRFYTLIRNYWILALVELYGIGGLLAFAVYGLAASVPLRAGVILSFGLLAVLCRIGSIRFLDQARDVTTEQVHVIVKQHGEQVRAALQDIKDGA